LRKRKHLVSDESAVEKESTHYEDPRDALLREEKEAILQRALSEVPLKFRTALVLKDIEGLSYDEIAQVLHCNIGTVESKIYRARQFLKKKLLKREGEAT